MERELKIKPDCFHQIFHLFLGDVGLIKVVSEFLFRHLKCHVWTLLPKVTILRWWRCRLMDYNGPIWVRGCQPRKERQRFIRISCLLPTLCSGAVQVYKCFPCSPCNMYCTLHFCTFYFMTNVIYSVLPAVTTVQCQNSVHPVPVLWCTVEVNTLHSVYSVHTPPCLVMDCRM